MRALFLALLIFFALPAQGAERLLNVVDKSESGGYQLWVMQDTSLPVISFEFSILGAGSRNDPPDRQGVRQLLSNTLDEGAGEYDARTFQNLLADNSISLRFWNSRDSFGGSLYTLSAHKDLAFKLLTLSMNDPRLESEAIERMRAANLTRLRNDSADPEWMAARLFNAVIYDGHVYAQNSGGTLKSLTAITRDDLKAAHQSMLSRPALHVAVVGDITPEEAKERVDALVKPWRKDPIPDTVPPVKLPERAQTVLYKRDIPQTILAMGMPGIPREDKDFEAAVVMNHIFGGGGFGSLLTERIREQEGLTYGIYSRLDTLDKAPLLSISTSTKNAVAGTVVARVREIMKTMRETEVSDKTLDDAKAYLTGSLPLDMTSLKATAKLMNGLQQENLSADYLDHYVAKIKAVTPADIRRLAERLLVEERMQVVMVGKPEKVKPTRNVDTLPGVEE